MDPRRHLRSMDPRPRIQRVFARAGVRLPGLEEYNVTASPHSCLELSTYEFTLTIRGVGIS